MSVRLAFTAAAALIAMAVLPSASEANWGHHRHHGVVAAAAATTGCFLTRLFHRE
jgi:hypothetical protein